MGSSETEAQAKTDEPSSPSPTKTEKPSSPPPEHRNVHVYPDWAAMQAYYGAGVALPPPYFNSAVPAGHPPHPYMWGPQPLMSPYGAPYAAMYPPGGIYAHPSLSLGPHGHGVQPPHAVGEALVASPLSIATPSKSSSTKDQGSKKKIKGSDGLAVSVGNGKDGSNVRPQSEEDGIEGSSEGSDGNTEAGGESVQGKKTRSATPPRGRKRRVNPQGGNGVSDFAGKQLEKMVPLRKPPALELMGCSAEKKNTVPSTPDAAMTTRDGLPAELWMQDERALKREKRKQSNRESARRSRLRKQAESEELALKVESLNVENMALRSEIDRLAENSKKLRIENTALMEKLKHAQSGEALASKAEAEGSAAPISTENLLSRVHNSDSVTMNKRPETGGHENPNSGAKFHQLLTSNPMADAVAAS